MSVSLRSNSSRKQRVDHVGRREHFQTKGKGKDMDSRGAHTLRPPQFGDGNMIYSIHSKAWCTTEPCQDPAKKQQALSDWVICKEFNKGITYKGVGGE